MFLHALTSLQGFIGRKQTSYTLLTGLLPLLRCVCVCVVMPQSLTVTVLLGKQKENFSVFVLPNMCEVHMVRIRQRQFECLNEDEDDFKTSCR